MLKKYWNQIYINRNVKFMPFLYHGSHLGFQGIIEREKNRVPFFSRSIMPWNPRNGTLFFLMFISYSNRIRRVFAFTKKYTNVYFMTNEPTLARTTNIFAAVVESFSLPFVISSLSSRNGQSYGKTVLLQTQVAWACVMYYNGHVIVIKTIID